MSRPVRFLRISEARAADPTAAQGDVFPNGIRTRSRLEYPGELVIVTNRADPRPADYLGIPTDPAARRGMERE